MMPLYFLITSTLDTPISGSLWKKKLITNCNDLDIKLVFSSFKIGNLFGVKDSIPGGLRSRVVYKFACAGYNACYVGEITRHFSPRVREHLVSDRASHIFKHLENSEHCRALCSADCFHILDHAPTTFQVIYQTRETVFHPISKHREES